MASASVGQTHRELGGECGLGEQDEADPDPAEPVHEKRRGGNATARTEALGSNPREARAQIWQTRPAGFYVCRPVGLLLRTPRHWLSGVLPYGRANAQQSRIRRDQSSQQQEWSSARPRALQ